MNPSGVYEIKYNTSSKNYVGQAGRPIATRHKEHIRYIKTNNPVSAYVTHILNNRHEYGTANDTLKLIQPCRKSMKLNHWENMYIQIYRQQDQLITEQQINELNSRTSTAPTHITKQFTSRSPTDKNTKHAQVSLIFFRSNVSLFITWIS
jgi:hypothetical protein